jgi:hypothetical protein
MSAVGRGAGAGEVQYLVLPDPSNPWLLARVRWPDVFQAISAAEPDWRSDPGLFDLPYDASSVAVTPEEAAAIAEAWGADFPSADQGAVPGPSLIRRMPANWSDLSPAVKRAWSIEPGRTTRRTPARESRWGLRRRRRDEASPVPAHAEAPQDELIVLSDVEPADVIDLTDVREAGAVATVEDV